MAGPTREFWQQRFVASETPWDRGAASPQLTSWLASGKLAPCRILVPGCGAGHEVAVLAGAGFDVTALDYAPAAIALTRERLVQANGRATLVQADVLEWQPGAPFDAIYEQTCLCAVHPDHWRAYADRLDARLVAGGRLYALWMQALRAGAAEGLVEGPPYHCGWGELAVVLERR
jgi:protein-L-isoaspartate O-methyltransferase